MARFIPEARSGGKFEIITDRLRRKYLQQNELAEGANVLDKIKLRFEAIPNRNVDWHRLGVNEDISTLNLSGNTIGSAFELFFNGFTKAADSATSFFDSFKIYQPVRIVFADMPDFIDDIDRPLAEYDENDSLPFWLR